MKKLHLIENETAKLEIRQAIEKSGKMSDRLKVILLYSEGWSPEMIAKALRLLQASIYRHIEEYQSGKDKAAHKVAQTI